MVRTGTRVPRTTGAPPWTARVGPGQRREEDESMTPGAELAVRSGLLLRRGAPRQERTARALPQPDALGVRCGLVAAGPGRDGRRRGLAGRGAAQRRVPP